MWALSLMVFAQKFVDIGRFSSFNYTSRCFKKKGEKRTTGEVGPQMFEFLGVVGGSGSVTHFHWILLG